MASTTGFFGLQKLQSGDPHSTNDYAFSNRNMDIIDRLLGKLEAALFDSDSPLDDPTDLLELTVEPTGGLIPAGRTVRYKYTWVDPFGNESAASPEAVISTPAPISRPSAPGTESSPTGGTLLAGNYFYIVSAYVNVNTSETSGSPAAAINVRSGSTNTITLTFPSLPAGADGFNVFRRGPGESQWYYLDSVDMTGMSPPDTYTDDNSIMVSNSRTPSATNLTNSTNLINITLPGVDPVVPEGYTWKIYRTFVSADYNSSLLEWVVTEDAGDVVPYAVDSGLKTTIGIPPATSSLTSPSSKIPNLEADVADIFNTLGTNPQGGYTDVAERLDAFSTAPVVSWVAVEDSIAIYVDDVITGYEIPFTLPNTSLNWTIEGQLFYETTVGEGLQFAVYTMSDEATPREFDLVKLQVDSEDGLVFEGHDPIILVGDAVQRGVKICGTLLNDGAASVFNVSVFVAQENTVATPAPSFVKAGSWFRFTGVGD